MPRRDDVHWRTAGKHEADAGIAEAFEVDPAQPGTLAEALKFVGVPLVTYR